MDLISNLMVKPLVYFPRKKIWFEGPMDFFNIDLDQMSNSCSEQSEAFVNFPNWLNFIYSEKATKFCEIFTVDLSYVVMVKSKVEILQNFVAFSDYMNFKQNKTMGVGW